MPKREQQSEGQCQSGRQEGYPLGPRMGVKSSPGAAGAKVSGRGKGNLGRDEE